MNALKKLWDSPMGKLSISFVGLLILLFSLTVNPLIVYFYGDDVPVVIYNAHRADPRFEDFVFVEPGVRDLTFLSLDVFSDELKERYDIDPDSLSRRFFDDQFYAVISVENGRSFVSSIVDKEPTEGIYLKIDYLFLSIDPVKTDEKFEETGQYVPVYDGVNVVYSNLISVLYNRIPHLNDRLQAGDVNVTLRIHRGRFIFVNP